MSELVVLYFGEEVLPRRLPGVPGQVWGPLRQALQQGRGLAFDYKLGPAYMGIEDVLPEAVFYLKGNWYLAAFWHKNGRERLFCLDRMDEVKVTSRKERSQGIAGRIRTEGVGWLFSGEIWKELEAQPEPENDSLEKLQVKLRKMRARPGRKPAIPEELRDRGRMLIECAIEGDTGKIRSLLQDGRLFREKPRYLRLALYAACRNGRLSLVKELIDAGADPENRETEFGSALIHAVRGGHPELVRYLVEEVKADVNGRDRLGWYPLFCAAAMKRLEIFRYLLEHGAAPEGPEDTSWAALPAVVAGMEEPKEESEAVAFCRLLLEAGAPVDQTDRHGRTALMLAVQNGSEVLKGLLLEFGAEVHLKDPTGKSVLDRIFEKTEIQFWDAFQAREKFRNGRKLLSGEKIYDAEMEIPSSVPGISPRIFSVLREGILTRRLVLLKYSDGMDLLTERKVFPEVLCCSRGRWYLAAFCYLRGARRTFRLDRIEMAILTEQPGFTHGIAEDIRDSGSFWPGEQLFPEQQEQDRQFQEQKQRQADARKFTGICGSGTSAEAAEWLAFNTDLNFLPDEKRAVHQAARAGFWETAEMLLGYGADISLGDRTLSDLLGWAVWGGSLELVQFLVEELDADVNARDSRGETLLNLAVELSREDILRWLIHRGADVNAVGKKGRTVLMHLCERANQQNLIRLLIDSGADVNLRDSRGNTALMTVLQQAGEKQEISPLLPLLVRAGADVNLPDRDGLVPLMTVRGKCFTWLLNHGADCNAADAKGTTVAMYHADCLRELKQLKRRAADFFCRNLDGEDVLLNCLCRPSILRFLVEDCKLPVNDSDSRGRTVLRMACEQGNLAGVQYLLNQGADLAILDREGRTPYDYLEDYTAEHEFPLNDEYAIMELLEKQQ